MTHASISLCITVLLAAPLAASADECKAWEDFDDGVVDPMWATVELGNQQVAEQNGRLEFAGTSGTSDDLSLAGFVGTGWQLDLSVDFLASGNGNMTLSNPGMAGVIGLVVIFTSTPDDPADADLDNAVIHFHGWYAGEIMEGIEVFQNGVSIYDDYEDGDSGTGENWFGYDMDNDTLYVDDSGFPDPWAYTGFGALLGNKVTVSIMALRTGTYGSNPGSQLWSDDWCLHFGQLTGASVGACCVAEDCVETLENSCEGTWHGSGSACSDVTCEAGDPMAACCVGTSCQHLTEADCAAASGSWHPLLPTCPATPCGGGAGCPTGWTEDCMGICFPDSVFAQWLGDGLCDSGAYVPYDENWLQAPPGVAIWLNCDDFDCDLGDCACPQCTGDVDGDGTVALGDITTLIGDYWGNSNGNGDVDGSGLVGVLDLLIVLENWGPCE